MGILHVFLGVNWYVELIASIRIKIGATEAISEAAEVNKLALYPYHLFHTSVLTSQTYIIA